MRPVALSDKLGIYELPGPIRTLVASTPETRAICNDPMVLGLRYTESLKQACARILSALELPISEDETNVVHLLRGSLNFGLREALGLAYRWNRHTSTFLSAQRHRHPEYPEEWEVGESEYRKLCFSKKVNLVMGDVVATGTSLHYGLKTISQAIQKSGSEIESVLLFTIGGPRSQEVLSEFDTYFQTLYPNYRGATVIYLEGRFPTATLQTPLSIKITGTDLLRQGSSLSPEFLASQYNDPAYPLERCTIYDAGSRSFDVAAYLADVSEYWQQVAALDGVSFTDYLIERCPGVDPLRFPEVDLRTLALSRVRALDSLMVEGTTDPN